MSIVISNAFTVIEGRPVTSSRIVAEYFGKHSTLTILYTLSDTLSKPFLGSTFANKILQLLIHCTQVLQNACNKCVPPQSSRDFLYLLLISGYSALWPSVG